MVRLYHPFLLLGVGSVPHRTQVRPPPPPPSPFSKLSMFYEDGGGAPFSNEKCPPPPPHVLQKMGGSNPTPQQQTPIPEFEPGSSGVCEFLRFAHQDLLEVVEISNSEKQRCPGAEWLYFGLEMRHSLRIPPLNSVFSLNFPLGLFFICAHLGM